MPADPRPSDQVAGEVRIGDNEAVRTGRAMRIAILSDIHDHIRHLSTALSQLTDVDALLCCGDLCSPFIVVQLGEQCAKPIHIVFGNNDGDHFRITQQAGRFPQVTLHGEFADLSLGGKRIAINHFPEIARPVAASGRYDLVCYGHDHTFHTSRDGQTLLVNPGEVFGGLTGSATYVVYDTDRHDATRRDIT